MKFSYYLFLILAICACTNTKDGVIEEVTNNNYVDITEDFSLEDFEIANTYILNNGDRQTYRAFDNNNPHYSFDGFEAYLNAEIGQKNINNDSTISDFNEITIKDKNANPQYYTIHVVRVGDTAKKDITIQEGMREGRVYLLNPYEEDIEVMKNNLKAYIQIIKSAKEFTTNKYADITTVFSINDFEVAKSFILSKGDRQTYRVFDSNNPHHSYNGFEAYLNAEIGQKNITNDPAISGFNEITIRDKNANPQYYTIHVVRIGDTSQKDITIQEGMREGRVYLLNPFENDLEVMKNNLNGYLQTIKSDKEQETGKPNIPVNDTIDLNSDKIPDFVISYKERATADIPSSGGSIIGSITPLQQNKLLYRENVGYLFLNITDKIRKTDNTNSSWREFSSDLISIHRSFQNWDSTWTILAEQKPFYFLAYKLVLQNSEEIGWICLEFNTEKGTISITDSDRTSNNELMINKKTTF